MKRLLIALGATGVLMGAPSGVFAQGGSTMPYQGIFSSGGNTDPNVHHRLDLTFSVAAGYDDDVLPSLTGGIDPTSKPFNGYNNTYTGTAQYAWQGRKMQAGLTATSALRQYTEFNDYTMTHAVGAGFAMEFARRTTLFVNQSANYSPPYLFGLFPECQSRHSWRHHCRRSQLRARRHGITVLRIDSDSRARPHAPGHDLGVGRLPVHGFSRQFKGPPGRELVRAPESGTHTPSDVTRRLRRDITIDPVSSDLARRP